jgi:dihydropyrimidine dehydrogenase (NAD+) subunit PreT
MPAFGFEHEHAVIEGVQFHWNILPLEIVTHKGRATGVRLAHAKVGSPDAGGKRSVSAVPGSETVFACDMVIPALGQTRVFKLLAQTRGIELSAGGIVVDRQTGRTTNPRFYAGGDCVNGGREVVDAVADGKRAACAMARSLEEVGNG